MLKQLIASATLATAFAATPVLAADHGQHGDDPNATGTTQSYEQMERKDGKVKPDKKAYDRKSDEDRGGEHPAHQMGDDRLDERGN